MKLYGWVVPPSEVTDSVTSSSYTLYTSFYGCVSKETGAVQLLCPYFAAGSLSQLIFVGN